MTKGVGGSDPESVLRSLAPLPGAPPRISPEMRATRRELARASMAARGLGALILPVGPSLRYFTGLAWHASERLACAILKSDGALVLVGPRFEAESLEAGVDGPVDLRLWEEDEDPFALAADAIGVAGAANTTPAFDPQGPYWVYRGLSRALGSGLADDGGLLAEIRAIKSPAEIALMSYAKQITLRAQEAAAASLAPGVTSPEVRLFIDRAHRALGADGGATFCLVSFGAASALPHGGSGEVLSLGEGDAVLIDTGCEVDGYKSDITRSYVFGEPDADYRRLWGVSRAAQQAAFEALRPGVTCESIDLAARGVIEAAGLGPRYGLPGLPHRTGHGIGTEVHEAPYLVIGDKTLAQPGMCFSNEPALYATGVYGVRIEDHMYVTETGANWFTTPPDDAEIPFPAVGG